MIRASLAAAALGAALLVALSPATAQGARSAGSDSLRVCVLEGDSLREVAATADAATGDTLVAGGQRLLEAYPPDRVTPRGLAGTSPILRSSSGDAATRRSACRG